MPLQASQQIIDGRATITNLVDDQTGRRATVMVPMFPEGTPLAKAAATLTVALENFAGNVRTASAQFLPNVVGQHLRMAATNVLRKPVTDFQSVAIAEQQAIAKATAVAMMVDPATLSTAPIRSRANRMFDGTDIAGKAALIEKSSMEELAGIIESGAIDELPADLAQVARDRYMLMRHVARTGLQANFQRQAMANDPLASGADTGAAMDAAQEALDMLKARSDDVDSAANVLRNVNIVAALACDLSVDAAFALLTGRNSAN